MTVRKGESENQNRISIVLETVKGEKEPINVFVLGVQNLFEDSLSVAFMLRFGAKMVNYYCMQNEMVPVPIVLILLLGSISDDPDS